MMNQKKNKKKCRMIRWKGASRAREIERESLKVKGIWSSWQEDFLLNVKGHHVHRIDGNGYKKSNQKKMYILRTYTQEYNGAHVRFPLKNHRIIIWLNIFCLLHKVLSVYGAVYIYMGKWHGFACYLPSGVFSSKYPCSKVVHIMPLEW